MDNNQARALAETVLRETEKATENNTSRFAVGLALDALWRETEGADEALRNTIALLSDALELALGNPRI